MSPIRTASSSWLQMKKFASRLMGRMISATLWTASSTLCSLRVRRFAFILNPGRMDAAIFTNIHAPQAFLLRGLGALVLVPAWRMSNWSPVFLESWASKLDAFLASVTLLVRIREVFQNSGNALVCLNNPPPFPPNCWSFQLFNFFSHFQRFIW